MHFNRAGIDSSSCELDPGFDSLTGQLHQIFASLGVYCNSASLATCRGEPNRTGAAILQGTRQQLVFGRAKFTPQPAVPCYNSEDVRNVCKNSGAMETGLNTPWTYDMHGEAARLVSLSSDI